MRDSIFNTRNLVGSTHSGPVKPAAAMLALVGAATFGGQAIAADLTEVEIIAAPAVQTVSYPFIIAELEVELENDLVFNSDDPDAEFNNLYPTIGFAAELGLNEYFKVVVGLTMEQLEDPEEDSYFEDVGLYMDTIHLQADVGGLSLLAGKYGPEFGQAWDNTPGLYGTSLAEDYEITEMIALGFAYEFELGDAGAHTLAANTFFADTTVLSESLITNRGRVSLSDGGSANTERFNNYAVALSGEEMAALPGLSYNLGFTYLSAGIGDVADQTGYVFGLAYENEYANGVTMNVTGEVAYFNNIGGTLDDGTYFTAGLELSNGSWHGELAGALRDINLDGGGSEDTSFVQLSGGYEFDNGLDLTLGYAYVDEDSVGSHVFGVRLYKAFNFATPGAPDEELDLPERPRVRSGPVVQ